MQAAVTHDMLISNQDRRNWSLLIGMGVFIHALYLRPVRRISFEIDRISKEVRREKREYMNKQP